MFKNITKLSHKSLKSINYRFCSQVFKPNNELKSKEDQNNCHKSKNEENCDKNLTEKQNNEMEKVVKTEEYLMDRIWELNQTYCQEKEHHKITDVTIEAHIDWRNRLERTYDRQKKYNFEIFKSDLKNFIQFKEENLQRYVARRHAKLGPELAVANFVVVRGGRVRFKHAPNVWATHLDHFPDKYEPRYQLSGVDASHTKLRYEGIDNFQELYSLEELDLSDNKLDDWCCDKIGRMFRNKNLVSLNLSNNPLITHRGIETLHRVRSLKALKISGTKAANYPFLELLILNFNDLVPDCRIISD